MRLCANENLPEACIRKLRLDGHDVVWMYEVARGSSDQDVLEYAQRENRLLLTFDKDFGELVFNRGVGVSLGIILFRIAQPSALVVAERVAAILASRSDWQGNFSVVDDRTIRMRPLRS